VSDSEKRFGFGEAFRIRGSVSDSGKRFGLERSLLQFARPSIGIATFGLKI
jgi:hypothetical protein